MQWTVQSIVTSFGRNCICHSSRQTTCRNPQLFHRQQCGVQDSDANVIVPSKGNAVPFEVAFDKDFFLRQVQQTFGIRAKLVPLDWDKEQLECTGMGSFQQADPHVVRQILHIFRPSEKGSRNPFLVLLNSFRAEVSMTVYLSIIGMETIGMTIVNDGQPFLMVCTGVNGLSYNPWTIEDYQGPRPVGSIIAVITMFQRNYQ